MKNKKAKALMLKCIKIRDNGECCILNKVSITGGDLSNGSVISHSTYIGDVMSTEFSVRAIGFKSYLGINS